MQRRLFLQSALAAGSTLSGPAWNLSAVSVASEIRPRIDEQTAWYDVQQWGVEGRGFNDTKKFFDRLPARAEATVRAAVWGLSRHSAGMMARFATNSTTIRVRYRLSSGNLAMSHMPATGVSGVDLYADNGEGEMKWVNVTRPTSQEVNAVLASRIDRLPENRKRACQLYLPLYNGVESLEVGVNRDSDFEPLLPRKEKPIVFYGTSIMHGACASRPGMCISSLVGRKLNRPVINLGFSGNGKMEAEVGKLICELNPAVIAVDCLPNMNAVLVRERTEKLVNLIRKAHPKVPLLLVEDRSFTNAPFFKSRRDHHAASRRELRLAYQRIQEQKIPGIHYLSGEQLLGTDGEGATDGSHPNDLGMVRYAEAYEKALRQLIPG